MHTKVFTAHVPMGLADKIDQLAAHIERPRGWIVKQALTAWVGQEEERRQLTLEALADVLVGHYEMRYEITQEALVILRIWHTRERR